LIIDSSNPIVLLQALEQENLGNQLASKQEGPVETWRGFTFDVGEMSLVVPFVSEVAIVPIQELSPVPITKEWVKGMLNVRGEIHTVVDFAAFIGLPPTRITKRCNLFLLPDARLKSALLIAGRINLKPFSSALPTVEPGQFHVNLIPYLSTVVVDQNQHWGVIDINALCGANDFVQIGL